MYQLDYGYEVRILEGKHKGKTGFVVMGSTHGDIGINLRKKPKIGDYQTRVNPSDLEIVSMENPHELNFSFGDLSVFQCARLMVRVTNPQMVLDNQKYFEDYLIESAKDILSRKS